MRLGLSSYAYRYAASALNAPHRRPLDAVGLLHRAARLGLDMVQFCDNVPLDTLSALGLDRLVKTSRELRLAVEVGTRGLEQERLLRYVDLAAAVGSRGLRLVLDSGEIGVVERALRAVLPRCRDRGITLALENHFDLASSALVGLIEGVRDPALGICLDTANSLGLLERPMETVRALAPYAVQVHLKDFCVEKAAIGYHVTGRPLGEGWLDLSGVMDALEEAGRHPDLFVELWMDPGDDPEATLAAEEQWVAQSVRFAREQLAR